ncbi:MAG: VOC family protein [Butyricicoccus sp.]
MNVQNTLLVVQDMERSKEFYHRVFGLNVELDFGANVTLTGGICLQTKETWQEFIGQKEIVFGGNAVELYFEEDDFDGFAERLAAMPDILYVHPVLEHRWGQRAVRIYDPDRHIIEVGEAITTVCRRFLNSGMTEEQVAVRMDVPLDYVQSCL